MEISNRALTFTCDPEKGTFGLFDRRIQRAFFQNARLRVQLVKGNRRIAFLEDTWEPFSSEITSMKDSHHGKCSLVKVVSGGSRWNIHLHLSFLLPESHDLLLWSMEVGNFGEKPIFIEQFDLLLLDGNKGGELGLLRENETHQLAFFSNGWQSWSYTATYGNEERQRRSRLGFLQNPQNVNPTTPVPAKKGQFTSDMFGVVGDRSTRKGILLGFLSQKQQFGSMKVDLNGKPGCRVWAAGDHVQVNPGNQIRTDLACVAPIEIDGKVPLDAYLAAVNRENEIPPMKPKPTGWCSWYEFYENIIDQKIERNIQACKQMEAELPLDLIQVDDGFETQVGDWFDFKPGFKQGVKPHAKAIKAAGKIPGLWLAPFIVDRRSRLFREHPEYILRDGRGMPVSSGFNWNSFTTALDLSQPEALKYVCEVVSKAVEDWGFDYLKLDFLYAAALPGRHFDRTLTRAQVISRGMEALRKAVGKKTFLLGCGAPLGPMVGIVDAMRIGADVLDDWRTQLKGIKFILENEPNTPAAINAIQNMLTRAMLHNQWWINDPDVLLIREDMHLTLDEVRSLASMIYMTSGMVLLSDDLQRVSPERLKIAKAIIPPLDQRPRILDWFDRQMPSRLKQEMTSGSGKWTLVSISNWDDKPRTLKLDLGSFGLSGEVWVRSFWDQTTHTIDEKKPLVFDHVAAHSTLVMAIREKQMKSPQYLGSDLHISQGMEVSEFRPRLSGLDIVFRLPRTAAGNIELHLPKPPRKVTLDGKSVKWLHLCDSRYFFEGLMIDHLGKLSIDY